MKHWLCQQHLKHHAKKHGASLRLHGDVAYADLTFGLQRGASWQLGKGAVLGKDGVLSLGEGACCSIGEHSQIGRRWSMKMLNTQVGAQITIGQGCRVEDDVKLSTFGQGKLDVADDCFVGWGCILSAQAQVSIGKGTAIAEYVSIRDHNHERWAGAVHLSPMQVKAVHIGEHVWIGAKVTIVAGVSIGDGAVVGANAVVTKDVSAGVKVAGVPACPIG